MDRFGIHSRIKDGEHDNLVTEYLVVKGKWKLVHEHPMVATNFRMDGGKEM